MGSQYTGADLVFGELPSWFELKVQTNLEDAHNLFEHLKKVEKNLLTAYISLIMAKAGYSNITLLDMYGFFDSEPKETTDFTLEDWVTKIDGFDCWEEFRDVDSDAMYEMIERHNEEWSVLYENIDEERITVTIASSDPSWYEMNLRDEGKSTPIFEIFMNDLNKETKNFVVAHPRVYELFKSRYKDFAEKVSAALGYKAFFSIEGFLHNLIPDHTRKNVLKETWIKIRESIFSDIRSKYPFMYRAAHSKRIEKIREIVQSAESKFAFGYQRNFRDVVSDSAIACEHILLVLYNIHIKRTSEENQLVLHDLIEQLKQVLTEKFTENTYADLHYIRNWRNSSVHASDIELDELNTHQVLSRMKLFYEEFMKYMEEIN